MIKLGHVASSRRTLALPLLAVIVSVLTTCPIA
jgi:hypothetical protein